MRFIYAETCSGVGGTARGDEEESVRGGGGGQGVGVQGRTEAGNLSPCPSSDSV